MPLLVGLEARAASLSIIKSQEGESEQRRLPDGLDAPMPGTGRGFRTRRAPGDYAKLNEGIDVPGNRPDTAKRIKRVVPKVADPPERQEGGCSDYPDPSAESDKARGEINPSETAHDFVETMVHDFIDTLTPVKQLQAWMAPGLIDVIADGTPGFDLPFCLRNRYIEDPFFKTILEAPKEYKNFEMEGGLMFLNMDQK
jgi:hypothetical protein